MKNAFHHHTIGLKRKSSVNTSDQGRNTLRSTIQPFKQTPSTNRFEQENTDHMNAHDLFSRYTADIIKEEAIFSR